MLVRTRMLTPRRVLCTTGAETTGTGFRPFESGEECDLRVVLLGEATT